MEHVLVIAEAGVNHNGSVDLAVRLVEEAANAGADVVKFQTGLTEKLISRYAQKADYQKITTSEMESQLEMCKKLEFSWDDHARVIKACRDNNIKFLSTPFDIDSLHFLTKKCGVDTIKIPSGEITNAPLLFEIGRLGKDVILSTGMSLLGEVEQALAILAYSYINDVVPKSVNECYESYSSKAGQSSLRKHVSLLHCTTEYPAPLEEVNLRCIDTLRNAFSLPVGYSDHTLGITIPIAAVARGATIIEKHFTLDRKMEGPDHKASLEPKELGLMLKSIRQVELAMGNGIKIPSESEKRNMAVARKSLVTTCNVKAGTVFTGDNLTVKRPGDGVSAIYYWDYLGKTATRDYYEDEIIRG
ncbi:N-acetylneuraminate synthase [Anaerovibrio sp. JC8]|uniref:N-acetylneuraminate synthase n=1 Tax=Anaerovibrio sp. JC8 TaxID=1240085 RepID=UPI000A0C8275|nr:N-acetylneuraminate synthase [Anaerovibrio sp. JC8]ORU01366.1 N-acetylneuraminate synthase [Anaerovibrio sp. JC8]